MTNSVHPFQRAHLGVAPFRCVGVRENWFVMEGVGRKPGGTCQYCGTGILYEFTIKDVNGKTFVVGSDCVAKTEVDPEGGSKVAGFREVRLAHARERRAAKSAAQRAQWKADREARYEALATERAAKAVQYELANQELVDWMREQTAQTTSEFIRSMLAAIKQWGGLTEGQQAAVEKMRARAVSDATSKHLGEEGKRMRGAMVKVTECRLIAEAQWDRSALWLVKLVTKDGDQLTWFGSKRVAPFEEYEPATFTVKGHDEWRGVKQTKVNRLAWDNDKAKKAVA